MIQGNNVRFQADMINTVMIKINQILVNSVMREVTYLCRLVTERVAKIENEREDQVRAENIDHPMISMIKGKMGRQYVTLIPALMRFQI